MPRCHLVADFPIIQMVKINALNVLLEQDIFGNILKMDNLSTKQIMIDLRESIEGQNLLEVE